MRITPTPRIKIMDSKLDTKATLYRFQYYEILGGNKNGVIRQAGVLREREVAPQEGRG